MATLSVALDTQTNLITVSEALTLDSLPEPIVIDSEVMLVTGGSGLVYSVTRGASGTARASHSIGATIVPWGGIIAGLAAAANPSASNPFTTLSAMGEVIIVEGTASAAAIKAGAVTVVAGVTGKVILPLWGLFHLNYTAPAFTIAGTYSLGDGVDQTLSDAGGIGTLMTQTADATLLVANAGIMRLNSALLGAAMKLVDAAGNPTNGNSSLDYRIAYVLYTPS